jgi:phosphoglucomutase
MMFGRNRDREGLLAELAEHNADVKRQADNRYANLTRFYDPEFGGVDVTETEKIRAIIARSQRRG